MNQQIGMLTSIYLPMRSLTFNSSCSDSPISVGSSAGDSDDETVTWDAETRSTKIILSPGLLRQNQCSFSSNTVPCLPEVSLRDIQVLQEVSSGSCGKVYVGYHKKSTNKEPIAIKSVILPASSSTTLSQQAVERAQFRLSSELEVLKSFSTKTPFIASLLGYEEGPAFDSSSDNNKKNTTHGHFAIEYCVGGELFYHFSRVGRFSNLATKFYMAELALAIDFLHRNGVMCRDLKLENIMLSGSGHIRLVDFGLARTGMASYFAGARTLCGTYEYTAPEMHQIEQQRRTNNSNNNSRSLEYGMGIDWWSFGVLMYELLVGLPPFYTEDRAEMSRRVLSEDLPLEYGPFFDPKYVELPPSPRPQQATTAMDGNADLPVGSPCFAVEGVVRIVPYSEAEEDEALDKEALLAVADCSHPAVGLSLAMNSRIVEEDVFCFGTDDGNHYHDGEGEGGENLSYYARESVKELVRRRKQEQEQEQQLQQLQQHQPQRQHQQQCPYERKWARDLRPRSEKHTAYLRQQASSGTRSPSGQSGPAPSGPDSASPPYSAAVDHPCVPYGPYKPAQALETGTMVRIRTTAVPTAPTAQQQQQLRGEESVREEVTAGYWWHTIPVSSLALDCIGELLQKDPRKRLGCGDSSSSRGGSRGEGRGDKRGLNALMLHEYFADIDWDLAMAQALPPPFVPSLAPTTSTTTSSHGSSNGSTTDVDRNLVSAETATAAAGDAVTTGPVATSQAAPAATTIATSTNGGSYGGNSNNSNDSSMSTVAACPQSDQAGSCFGCCLGKGLGKGASAGVGVGVGAGVDKCGDKCIGAASAKLESLRIDTRSPPPPATSMASKKLLGVPLSGRGSVEEVDAELPLPLLELKGTGAGAGVGVGAGGKAKVKTGPELNHSCSTATVLATASAAAFPTGLTAPVTTSGDGHGKGYGQGRCSGLDRSGVSESMYSRDTSTDLSGGGGGGGSGPATLDQSSYARRTQPLYQQALPQPQPKTEGHGSGSCSCSFAFDLASLTKNFEPVR